MPFPGPLSIFSGHRLPIQFVYNPSQSSLTSHPPSRLLRHHHFLFGIPNYLWVPVDCPLWLDLPTHWLTDLAGWLVWLFGHNISYIIHLTNVYPSPLVYPPVEIPRLLCLLYASLLKRECVWNILPRLLWFILFGIYRSHRHCTVCRLSPNSLAILLILYIQRQLL